MPTKRRPNQPRPTTIEAYPTSAAGSVVITQGQTRVLCTASITEKVPPWMQGNNGDPPSRGWVTAEYAMLPGSTPDRKRRGTDSRATEIQRLIGRVLRAVVDMERIPGLTINCDCDVLVADGGTRTAAITGAYVALAQAIAHGRNSGIIYRDPLHGPVAAISTGIIDGTPHLDLDYDLDSRAEVDLNVAMDHRGHYVEIQGTAEQDPFTPDQLQEMLKLANKGIRALIRAQRSAIKSLKGD